MAAVVFAVPCRPYLYSSTPTDVNSGGTEIAGIEERDLRFDTAIVTRRRRTGVGANSGYRERRGIVGPGRLVIALRDQSANGLKILLAHLTTDGSTFRPTGGTAALPFAKMPTFDMVIRPDSSTEKHLYCPNWAPTQESLALIAASDDFSQLDGAELVLEANRPTNASGPAWMWDTSANINTAYGL